MRAINAAVLWMVAVIGLYCFAMHHDRYELKYYPMVNQLHFDNEAVPEAQRGGRIKFVTVALSAMVVALPVLLVGALLPPKKSAPVIHVLGWLAILGGGVVMFIRELHRF